MIVSLSFQNKIQNRNKVNLPQKQFTQLRDTVNFCSRPLQVYTILNVKEKQKLTRLFAKSFIESLSGKKNPSPKKENFFHNLIISKVAHPFQKVIFQDNTITETIKTGNEILGGYTLAINHYTKEAHIGFVTLTNSKKGSREALKVLTTIANRIHDNSNINQMEYITWTTAEKNKGAMKLFKRCNPVLVKKYFNTECEFKIDINNFKKFVDEYSEKVNKYDLSMNIS